MHEVLAKSILSAKNGMNLYRGCTHGCIYCDSRSTVYGMDHKFEDVAVKSNAPELLEEALKKKRKPCMIGTGSMCDPYMPVEEKVGLTRRALELIDKYGFGVSLITKSSRVLRDIDLLDKINKNAKTVVMMTLTTYDQNLCRIIEPNVSTTFERFLALKELKKRGIPTVVWLTPILPFINDTEENINGILDYCIEAGVKGVLFFGAGVTLRDGNREYFYEQLDRYFPGTREKYESKFGDAYACQSPNSFLLENLVKRRLSPLGIMTDVDKIFAYANEFPEKSAQISLFDEV